MATPEEQATVDIMARYVAERMNNGMSHPQMVDELVQDGYPRDYAVELVDYAGSWRNWRKQNRRRDGQSHFAGGIGLMILGFLITLGTWYWAGPGGTYIATFGLIAIGGLFALEGIYKTLTNADGVASFVRCFSAFAVVIAIVVGGGGWVFNQTVFTPF